MKLLARGNRLFTVTWAIVVLAAIGHTTAIFNDFSGDPAMVEILDAAERHTFAISESLSLSFRDAMEGAWVQLGGLLAGFAVVNLVVVGVNSDPSLRRALVCADLAVFVPLTALFVVYPIPPALISFGLPSVLLGVDLFLSARRD